MPPFAFRDDVPVSVFDALLLLEGIAACIFFRNGEGMAEARDLKLGTTFLIGSFRLCTALTASVQYRNEQLVIGLYRELKMTEKISSIAWLGQTF